MENSQIPPQLPEESKSPRTTKKIVIICFILFLFASSISAVYFFLKPDLSIINNFFNPQTTVQPTPGVSKIGITQSQTAVAKFSSAEDFKSYIQKVGDLSQFSNFSLLSSGNQLRNMELGGAPIQSMSSTTTGGIGVPDRSSETNVQVKGIDEPDIIKTDGKNIYFSSNQRGIMPLIGTERSSGSYLPQNTGKTKVISALPISDLAVTGNIDKAGDLLVQGNILVVFSGQQILGYDIKDPANPSQKWKIDLDQKTYLTTSRLYQGKIYFITQTGINVKNPCPFIPMSVEGINMPIPCTSIYHPQTPVPIDTTYTVSVLDPSTGKVENNISFVSAGGSTTVYMSENAVYIAYSYSKDQIDLMYNFFKEKGKDLISSEVLQKLEKLQSLDISSQAKSTELSVIISKYTNGLSEDENLKMQNEMTNRMKDYSKEHLRDYEITAITKIKIDNLTMAGNGGIPGHLLNQFSIDEYQDNLRVATTVGSNFSDTANDVYILDKDLKTVGSILNLGLGERIYSARFIEDKGYLVTFKQTDPFYILDLSNPKNPQKTGELKIPGYSSYLDLIAKNRVLGIGKEGQNVKISLFDVSSATNPLETDKYLLDEYWSESLNNHHAFLLDDKHKVFFLPGGNGGYVFSYDNDKLFLKKAISGMQIKRAIYINDFMYIVGEAKIVVLDEKTWEEIKQLTF